MKTSSVKKAYFAEIHKLQAEGIGVTKIKTILEEKYNTSISKNALYKLTKKWREDRSEAAKHIYVDQAASFATNDLKTIGRIIEKLNERLEELFLEKDDKNIRNIADVLFKYLNRRIELSGGDIKKNQKDEIDAIRDEWIEKLQQMR